MMKLVKFASIFTVSSALAARNNDVHNEFDVDNLNDDADDVVASRDYLKFLSKKYRQMAATESDSESRQPYEERLSKLRALSSHGAGCNATNGSANSSNSTNGSSNCGNATVANVTTAAPTTKAATTKAATTKAATTAAATTAAPTTKAVEQKASPIKVEIKMESSVTGLTKPADKTLADLQKTAEDALNSKSGTAGVLETTMADGAVVVVTNTLTKVNRKVMRSLSENETYDMKMDWTLTFNVATLDAAKTVVTIASAAVKKLATADSDENKKFIAAFNAAFTEAGVANPAGTLDASKLTVKEEIAFTVTSSEDAKLSVTGTGSDLAALDSAIATANATTGAAATTAAADDGSAKDDTSGAAKDDTSGAFERTVVSSLLLALASSALF